MGLILTNVSASAAESSYKMGGTTAAAGAYKMQAILVSGAAAFQPPIFDGNSQGPEQSFLDLRASAPDAAYIFSGTVGKGNKAVFFGDVTVSGTLKGGTVSPTPAGSDTQVQYNDDGTTAGASGLLYTKADGATTVNSSAKLQFRDSGLYINSPGDAQMVVSSDGTLDINVTNGVTFDSSAAGLSLDGVTDSNFTVTGAGQDLVLAAAGGGAQKLQLDSAGTGTDAIDISAAAGGIDIDAATAVDILAASTLSAKGATGASFGDDVGTWEFDGDGAVSETGMTTFSLTPSSTVDIDAGGALTLDGSSITIGGDSDVAVDIDSSTLDIDASGAVTIDTSAGGISLDAAAASNFSTAAGALTLAGAAGETIGTSLLTSAFQGNVTVAGDLTVSGQRTAVDSTSMNVKDNIVVLNSASDAAGVDQDVGLIFARAGIARSLFTDASDSFKFKFVTTATSGTAGSITPVANAVVRASKWEVDGASDYIELDTDLKFVAAAGITLDAATTVKIDSDSGDISFEDGGVAQLAIDMDGTAGEIIIQPKVASDDLVFKTQGGTEALRIEDDAAVDFGGGAGSSGVTITAAGQITADGRVIVDDTTDAASKTDGSLQTDGGLSVAKAIYNGTAATLAADSGVVTMGAATAATVSAAGIINVNNTTDASNKTDGSLQTDGGLSVAKAIYNGTGATLAADSGVVTMGAANSVTVSAAGLLDVANTTDSTSVADGALVVDGGVGIAKKLFVGTDLDVDGTSNLDAVDIDGAVQIDNTVTVGVNDTGYDVKFFGDTSGKYMLWDTSADALVMQSTSRIYFNDSGGEEYIAGQGDGYVKIAAATGITVDASFSPTVDNSLDLGTSSKRWANIYTGDLHLANERGNWTVVEESDMLTLRNNLNGKWYRMAMEEIDPSGRDEGMNGAPPNGGDPDWEL